MKNKVEEEEQWVGRSWELGGRRVHVHGSTVWGIVSHKPHEAGMPLNPSLGSHVPFKRRQMARLKTLSTRTATARETLREV